MKPKSKLSVVKSQNKPLTWRNRHGERVLVRTMKTSYLYNTVKMLWNNILFPNRPFGNVIVWKLSHKNYPRKQLVSFFETALRLLKKRKHRHIAAPFLSHVGNTSIQERRQREIDICQKSLQELYEEMKTASTFEVGEKVKIPASETGWMTCTMRGIIESIGRHGGWCGYTGKPIPVGEKVYYIRFSKFNNVMYSFSDAALRKT